MNKRINPGKLILLPAALLFYTIVANAQVVQIPDTIPGVNIPEVVISALRLPFRESTVPYSITLMNTRKNTQGLSLSETLAGIPGMVINARYNYAVGDRITNRGFGARTQFGVRGIRILYDDMPVTFADGQTNLEMIDLQNLDYVEFLRGPGSALYGNASGGILLLHSNPITDYKFLSSLSSTYGSHGLFRLTGQVELRTGKTGILLNATDFSYSGFREHSSSDLKRAFLKINSDISSRNNILFEAGTVRFNALNPGSLTREEYERDPTLANPMSVSNAASQDGSQSQIMATWKHLSDSISNFKITLYGISRKVVNPIIGKIVVLPQYSIGATATYNSEFAIGRKKLSWSAGTEIAMRNNDRKNYININGEQGSIIVNQKESIIASGFFLQGLLPASEKLNIDACLRYDLTHFGVNNLLADTAGGNPVENRNMSALNPSIGLIYRVLQNMRLFGNISTSFETPTSTELVNTPEGLGGFNPELKPARALQYETGLRGYISSILTYDIAAYIIQTRDELIPYQVSSAPGQDYYRNAGSTLRKGGEAALRFTPVSYLELNASLTYIDASYKDFTIEETDYSGKKIPGISRIHGVAEIKMEQKNGLFISLLLQSFSKMYVNDANSESSDPYGLFDIGLGHNGFAFGKHKVSSIKLSGGISNVLNKKYISSVSVNAAANRYYEPGPGRTFFINGRIEFGSR
jgi:iron complex outermembrane recepter protein